MITLFWGSRYGIEYLAGYVTEKSLSVLGFIGVKLIFEAMHENSLEFLNDVQPITWAPQIPIWLSLSIISGVLMVTIVASLLKAWQDPRNGAPTTGTTERSK